MTKTKKPFTNEKGDSKPNRQRQLCYWLLLPVPTTMQRQHKTVQRRNAEETSNDAEENDNDAEETTGDDTKETVVEQKRTKSPSRERGMQENEARNGCKMGEGDGSGHLAVPVGSCRRWNKDWRVASSDWSGENLKKKKKKCHWRRTSSCCSSKRRSSKSERI